MPIMEGLEVRQVRMDDRERLAEMTRDIWEGHDYMMEVFEEWVKDEEGIFLGLEREGRLAAVGRVDPYGKDEGWCEGLRVAEEFRGEGLAQILTDHVFKEASRRELKTLRLSTHVRNEDSIHIIKKYGFTKDGEYRILNKEVPEEVKENFARIKQVKNMEEIEHIVFNSRWYRLWNGYISYGWVFRPLTETEIEKQLDEGNVFRQGENNLAILVEDSERTERLNIGFLAGNNLKPLISFSAQYAHRKGRTVLNCMTPPGTVIEDILLEKDFTYAFPDDPPEVRVFSREI